MSASVWDGVCPRTVHLSDGMHVCGQPEPCPDHNEGFRCHWTHTHGPHPWTPLLIDRDSRVMYLDVTDPVICPGLTGDPDES